VGSVLLELVQFGLGDSGLRIKSHSCLYNPQHLSIEDIVGRAEAARNANDTNAALCWMDRAARLGDANSQRRYGNALFHEQDYSGALQYWELAASQGDATAARQIAVIYSKGLGVPQDNAKAQYWSSVPPPHINKPCDENNPTHISGDEAGKMALAAARAGREAEGMCWLWIVTFSNRTPPLGR
jgi:Sel1 repeat